MRFERRELESVDERSQQNSCPVDARSSASVWAMGVWLAAESATAADIAMRATAAPQGTVVRLGDVADVSAESKQEAERLAAMPLMPAPAPGTERFSADARSARLAGRARRKHGSTALQGRTDCRDRSHEVDDRSDEPPAGAKSAVKAGTGSSQAAWQTGAAKSRTPKSDAAATTQGYDEASRRA